MRKCKIVDQAYFRDLVLIIGSDRELDAWLQKRCFDVRWNDVNGKWLKFPNDRTHYILLSTKTKGVWRQAVLAHEVLHLTFAVLSDAGITLSESSEEAFTYYFQGMFAQCLKHLR